MVVSRPGYPCKKNCSHSWHRDFPEQGTSEARSMRREKEITYLAGGSRVTQQTCLLYDAGDRPAVSHSRHVCCVTQQTLSAVSYSRHVCCVTQTQHTCLLCDRADLSAF